MSLNHYNSDILNIGFWTLQEKKIYNKYIYHIIYKNMTFKQLSLIIKTRNRTQVRTHHQKKFNEIKKINSHLNINFFKSFYGKDVGDFSKLIGA